MEILFSYYYFLKYKYNIDQYYLNEDKKIEFHFFIIYFFFLIIVFYIMKFYNYTNICMKL